MNSNQAFHTRTTAEAATDLDVNLGHGLDPEEAYRRVVQYG